MPDISKLSLKALRDQILAGTREVTFRTDDGSLTQMVYIPRFRIPAGLWEGGSFPPTDLNLGGFFIDKYECSHRDATSTSRGVGSDPTVAPDSPADVAVSLPGRVPWTDITFPNAKQACANRKINGVRCHLVTMREWFAVVALIKLLGHDIRGNNSWGRDERDADVFENYGVPDPVRPGYSGHAVARVLTGSGPTSWFHNGQANGIADLVGNVWEWVDFTINDSVYTHVKRALINDADGITATDTAIVIDNIEAIQDWPAANGLVYIEAVTGYPGEYIRYGSIVNNGDGTATLSSCTRGLMGTTAGAHPDNTPLQQRSDYCLVPGGAKGTLGAAIDAAAAAISVTDVLLGPGGAALAVGDTLQVETEQMQITAVNQDGTYTVTRGANGSTAAAHAAGVAVVKLSPQMGNYNAASTDPSWGAYQFNYMTALRTEPDLLPLGIPRAASGSTGEYKDGFWARWVGQRAALRGGNWADGATARSGFALYLGTPPSYVGSGFGFRAALSL